MVDLNEQTPAQLLMRDMGLTEKNIARRRHVVGLDERDLARIASLKEPMASHVEEYTSAFFEYLGALEEGRAALQNRAIAERARELKRAHLLAMVQTDYGADYAAQRLELALLYSRAGLELRVFLAAFHHLLKTIGSGIMSRSQQNPSEGFETFASLKKVAFFDIGIIVDVIVFERERVIRQQQDAIRELSTPVLQIRERLLLLPIVGVIDTRRARMITENLLMSIRASRARVVVMDITGVATIDSRVANHLIQTVTAARLMGASVIVTGLSAEVAQSLVALGIDLSKLNTIGDLQGGLEEAERLLGHRLVVLEERPGSGTLVEA